MTDTSDDQSMHEHWNETLDRMKERGWDPSPESEAEHRAMFRDVIEVEEQEDLSWKVVER